MVAWLLPKARATMGGPDQVMTQLVTCTLHGSVLSVHTSRQGRVGALYKCQGYVFQAMCLCIIIYYAVCDSVCSNVSSLLRMCHIIQCWCWCFCALFGVKPDTIEAPDCPGVFMARAAGHLLSTIFLTLYHVVLLHL